MTRVTAIVPCFQQGHLLPEAVESALAQTYLEVEVVIVDDGSTDTTAAVAGAYAARHPDRVRVVTQPNRGLAMARGAGLAAARGEFVISLDADDILEPNMVATCLAAAGDADTVVGNAWLVAADGRTVLREFRQTTVPGWPAVLEWNPFGAIVAVLARTASVRRVGGMAVEGLRACEDWDLWIRMIRCGMRFATVDAFLGRYRQTATGLTRDVLVMLDARIAVLDRAAAEDPRLRGLAAAPPIDPAAYARLRNGGVFHALGSAAATADLGLAGHALARLVPGALDPSYCGTQLAWGVAHAHRLGTSGAPVTPEVVGLAIERCRALGLGARAADLPAAVDAALRAIAAEPADSGFRARLARLIGRGQPAR